jgi:hypothetical protein
VGRATNTLAASATTSYLRLRAAITPAVLQHAAVHGYTTAYWTATAIFTAGALLTALLYHSGRTDPADLTSTVPAWQPRPRTHPGHRPQPGAGAGLPAGGTHTNPSP